MESLLVEEFPKIVASGVFGNNVNYVSFEKNENLVGQDQYMSLVLFGTIITSDESRHDVLIKFKTQDKVERVTYFVDFQFHNEILMYEKIIPFLLSCRRLIGSDLDGPLLPRYFYGRNNFDIFVENDLIILENANSSGFRLTNESLFLDYEHLVMALQALAMFHGLSYIAKHKDPVGFQEAIADIRNTQWNADGHWYIGHKSLQMYSRRGIDRLLKRSGGDGDASTDSDLMRRFNGLVEDQDVTLRRALEPSEPTSVLCHGDFNRNNMLFRYDGDTGRPTDVLLFDFGTPRYGSPALDLSFMLYMNTSRQLRDRQWDELLDIYCATLAAAVPSGVRVPDRAELDAEMVASAVFGYAHVSFFLPKQADKLMNELGSDNGSEYIADVIQHFISRYVK